MQTTTAPASRNEGTIPEDAYIGHVHLHVADIDRSLGFYRDLMGFDVIQRIGDAAVFISAGKYHHHLGLNTWQGKGAPPPPPGTAGLYHFAINYPTRHDLAIAAKRLLDAGWAIDGMSKHSAHDALYLRDPDENGIELAWDLDRSAWPKTADEKARSRGPLDLAELVAEADGATSWPGGSLPAETRIGHVHLKVSDLHRSVAFYRDVIGFHLRDTMGDSAVFLAAGDYHHHLGLNTWESKGGPPQPQGHTGIYHFAINYPTRREFALAVERLFAHNWPIDGLNDHGTHMAIYLHDPDGIGIEFAWDRERDEWPRDANGNIVLTNGRAFDVRALIAETVEGDTSHD
jgi:catechol 2,3-dioxygenase